MTSTRILEWNSADRNTVTAILVPGHSGYEGNIEVDRLARLGSENSIIRPESALEILKRFFREAECGSKNNNFRSELTVPEINRYEKLVEGL